MRDGPARSVHRSSFRWIARGGGSIFPFFVLACRSAPATFERALPNSDSGAALSIAEDDPQWGKSVAPVTIVWFGDFVCPFTAKSAETMRQLEAEFGPETLRVVWKSEPHPFSGKGIELAEAGAVVR